MQPQSMDFGRLSREKANLKNTLLTHRIYDVASFSTASFVYSPHRASLTGKKPVESSNMRCRRDDWQRADEWIYSTEKHLFGLPMIQNEEHETEGKQATTMSSSSIVLLKNLAE